MKLKRALVVDAVGKRSTVRNLHQKLVRQMEVRRALKLVEFEGALKAQAC